MTSTAHKQQAEFNEFASGDHRVIHGDCADVMDKAVEDESVDLVFADPPYNIGKRFADFHDKWSSDREYANWCYGWLDLCIRKLTPTGTIYLMTSTQAMPYLDLYLRDRLSVLSRIVWHYDSSGVQARKYFGSLYEPILMATKDKRNYTFNASDVLVEARTGATRKLIDYRKPVPTEYNSSKVPGNVWYFSRVRYRMEEYEEHPTQKPEKLIAKLILASTEPEAVVLDPFLGSGTTSAPARAANSHWASVGRLLPAHFA